jgi:hypothetical protein
MYAAHARHAYVLLLAVVSVGSGLAFVSCMIVFACSDDVAVSVALCCVGCLQ